MEDLQGEGKGQLLREATLLVDGCKCEYTFPNKKWKIAPCDCDCDWDWDCGCDWDWATNGFGPPARFLPGWPMESHGALQSDQK